MALKPVSVSQLNSYISRIIKSDPIVSNIGVTGEVSGLKYHSSGHVYLDLKDENSKIKCFIPQDRARDLRFILSDGMKICAYGSVNVYEPGGYYSLNVRSVEAEGEGDLKKAFDLLKAKLLSEGLFDQSRKRPVPEFPKKVGIITSSTGAAVKDIVSTVRRRNPFIDLLLYPCSVQGENSAKEIAAAINKFNELFPDTDVLIVGRGGGSAEDLWSFNEECVARAVYGSAIPVISAVGHEQDYVISDYAADLRAATPTAAAELVSPDISFIKDRIERCSPKNLSLYLRNYVEGCELDLKSAVQCLDSAFEIYISGLENRIEKLRILAEAYNPRSVLEKGYAIVKMNDTIIPSAGLLSEGNKISLIFKDGSAQCIVEETVLEND